MCHGHVYAFTYFRKALEQDSSVNNREVILNLCMLFGASSVIKYATPIIEGGFITPDQISALRNFK
jgi:predicted MFS family arabinose efflux permease